MLELLIKVHLPAGNDLALKNESPTLLTVCFALQDEEKSVRQRRKLTSDTSEVSDC